MGLRGVLGTWTLPSVNFIHKETEYEDRINVKKISFHPAIKISLVVGGGGGGVLGFEAGGTESRNIERLHDVTSAKTIKWRPCGSSPVGVKRFSYLKTFSCSSKFA